MKIDRRYFASYVSVKELSYLIKCYLWENGGNGFISTISNGTTKLAWFTNEKTNPYTMNKVDRKIFYSLQNNESSEELLKELENVGIIAYKHYDFDGLYALADWTYNPYRFL